MAAPTAYFGASFQRILQNHQQQQVGGAAIVAAAVDATATSTKIDCHQSYGNNSIPQVNAVPLCFDGRGGGGRGSYSQQ